MSKRKRGPKDPAPDESSDDAAKDDMVHVTPGLLAGGPDIFAAKKGEPEDAPAERPAEPAEWSPEPPAAAAAPEPEAEAAVKPEPEPSSEEPATEHGSEHTSELTAEAPLAEPTPTPPAYAEAIPYQPQKAAGGGSSTALGIVLVVVGVFALLVAISGADLTQYGWPLFIIIPGLTLIIVGFLSVGAVATVPGGIVTMVGLVLAYSNATGDWPFWAYGWSLVTPGGVGIGLYLQGLRDRDQNALRTGRTLMFISLLIFLIGFVLFESILGISGREYFGTFGKAAFPALMILVGIILIVRRMQQRRLG